MKEALLHVYQQRLDKCTSEQFWAVALLASLCAFVLLQRSSLAPIPAWIVGLGVALTTFAAAAFVYSRHRIYLFYDARLVELARGSGVGADLPHPAERTPSKRLALSSGVVFYLALSAGMGAATTYVCFATR